MVVSTVPPVGPADAFVFELIILRRDPHLRDVLAFCLGPQIPDNHVVLDGVVTDELQTLICDLPNARDGVKIHLITGDFNGHEYQIGIEPFHRNARSPVDVACPQLAP